MNKVIGLKEFRQNIKKYAARVKRGDSFIVLKRSKPLFKIQSPRDEEWEEVIDFTKIKKGGIKIDDLLSRI